MARSGLRLATGQWERLPVSGRSGGAQVGPSVRATRENVPAALRDSAARPRTRPNGCALASQDSPLAGYFAVFALFCFGFLGVLAFLSMSLLVVDRAGGCRPGDATPTPG